MIATENYNVAFAQKTLEPRYVIALSFDDDDKDITYLTSHADCLVPPGTAAIDRIDGVIGDRGISGQSQRVSPDDAQHTIGSVTFKLIDVAGAISAKINTKLGGGEGLRKKRVQLFKGEATLTDWDDYNLRLTYLIDNKVSYINGVYTLYTSDIQRTAKTEIFIPHQGNLTSTIGKDDLTIPVTVAGAVTKFPLVAHDDIYSAHPDIPVGYIKIDDEIICHSGWADDTFSNLGVIQRGALNTDKAIHEVNIDEPQADKKKKIEEYIYLEMAGPKMIYAILTGILHGQAANLPDHWHLSIATKYVRLADFTGIGQDLWDTTTNKGRIARFMGITKQKGKKFIEQELALWSGLFLRILSDGAYGVKRLNPVLPFSNYSSFIDETQISSYTSLNYDQSAIINNISIDWNWLDSQERYTKTTQLIDGNSISKYGTSPQKQYQFRGVFTGIHSNSDLKNYFNAIRDRYAAPPLRLSLVLLPAWDRLNVGDTVRVKNQHIWDYNANDTLDRTFEVQGVKTDWINGQVMVALFGGVEPAVQTASSEGFVMSDSYYAPADGTELSTVLTIVGGEITVSGTLTGDDDRNNAVYFYDGDLTIGTGVIVNFTKSIELRIKGAFVCNGDLVGDGSGHVGGALSNNDKGNPGISGATGHIGSSLGILEPVNRASSPWVTYVGEFYLDPYVAIEPPSITSLNILNPDGESLTGIPNTLQGSSGSAGDAARSWNPSQRFPKDTPFSAKTTHLANGGAGGNSGAGILIVSRGGGFGANGSLTANGEDGLVGDSFVRFANGGSATLYAGAGVGGSEGTIVWLIDGNAATPLKSFVEANNGATPAAPATYLFRHFYGRKLGNGESAAILPLYQKQDHRDNSVHIGYIPPAQNGFVWFPADEDRESVNQGYGGGFIPADVTNFIVSQSGGPVIFKWKPQGEGVVFEIRYGPRGSTTFEDATPLTVNTSGSNFTSSDVKPGDWTFFIIAKSDIKQIPSPNSTLRNLVVVSEFDIVVSQLSGPEWPGTLSGFVKHWAGKLVPSSTAINADIGWRTFDEFVPDPVAIATYEGEEIDIGFDDGARVWGEITSVLGPSETGIANPLFQIDYHLGGGVYDGFEPWSIGQLYVRYAKAKLTLDTSEGVAVIEDMELVVDQDELTQGESGVTIASGGTAVVFPVPYHRPPQVQVFAEGNVAVLPTYELVTETGFTFHLFDTSANDTGGIGGWRATGV